MKTESKHTPGPWKVTGGKDPNRIHVHQDSSPFEQVGGIYPLAVVLQEHRLDSELKANARLIAAAPELLEACKWALPLVVYLLNKAPFLRDPSELTAFREAIAKAEGSL